MSYKDAAYLHGGGGGVRERPGDLFVFLFFKFIFVLIKNKMC